jgi:hypothetical protein
MFLENCMFTFDTHKQTNGNFYSVQPLKYPMKLGITGYCFENNLEKFYTNDPRRNKYFQPEIDNTTGASVVKNILLGRVTIW